MLAAPLRRLQIALGRGSDTVGIYLLAALAAAATVLTIACIGFYWEIVRLQEVSRLPEIARPLPPYAHLGRLLKWPTSGVVDNASVSVLVQLMIAIGVAMLLVVIASYLIYALATRTAINRGEAIYRKLFADLDGRSRRDGITATGKSIKPIISEDLASVYDASVRWLRTGPRHLLQMIFCCALVLLIDPLLGAITIVAALLLRQLVAALEGRRRRRVPVITEQRNRAADELSTWVERSQVLRTVYPPSVLEPMRHSLLTPLRKVQYRLHNITIWKLPTALAVGTMLALILFAVATRRVLVEDSYLSTVAVLVLFLSTAAAFYSFMMLRSADKATERIASAAEHLIGLFDRSPAAADPEVALEKIQPPLRRIDLRAVTVSDAIGVRRLGETTLTLVAGQVSAIVSNHPTSRSAVAELLLGFGQPSTGSVVYDDLTLGQIDLNSLSATACFVTADGPLHAGRLSELLQLPSTASLGQPEIVEVLTRCRVLEAVRSLDEGLATVITDADDRLGPDVPFRLGLARAMFTRQSLVVAIEPTDDVDEQTAGETLQAIQAVAAAPAIVVVLPCRSRTLWTAQQVILVGDEPAVVGKHVDLLERDDLYRHWNYIQFSPYTP